MNKKNILFSTGHPAQIHNFRNLKIELEKLGHSIFWLATEKDVSRYLLNYYNIDYSVIARPKRNVFSKFITLIKNVFITYSFIRKNKIDIAFSRVSPYVTIACILTGRTHFALTDTESAGIYDIFFGRFVTVLFTAKSFKRKLRSDQLRFAGNIELFYLHPNRYNSTDDIDSILPISKNQPYVLMRFVSWDAYHDKGLLGFTDQNKWKAVSEFSKIAKVFISSENALPEYLEPYRIKIAPEKMHDVLANAILFFGESATMASESAVLGTAAIYLDKVGRGYTDEEEEYGLVFNFRNDEKSQITAIEKGLELLKKIDIKEITQNNRKRFLNSKIDPTAFFFWFIENYPQSVQIMRENPDYQLRFK